MENISIIGSGHTKFGRLDASLEQMIVDVVKEAVEESGIAPEDIDAVYLGHFNSGLVPDGFASSLIFQAYQELRFKPAMRAENACASGSAESSPRSGTSSRRSSAPLPTRRRPTRRCRCRVTPICNVRNPSPLATT